MLYGRMVALFGSLMLSDAQCVSTWSSSLRMALSGLLINVALTSNWAGRWGRSFSRCLERSYFMPTEVI